MSQALLAFLHRLSCGGLAGAQLFFAAVAAQVVFPAEVAALPQGEPRRTLAADLVGAMLARLDAATLAGAALAAVLGLLLRSRAGAHRAAALLPLAAALLALLSAGWVTPEIQALRAAGRTQEAWFGLLHGISALVLLCESGLLAAALWEWRAVDARARPR